MRWEALTDRKDEAPPSHIEREPAGNGHHHDSHDEPDDCETPQDEAHQHSDGVENVAGISYVRERVSCGEEAFGEFTEYDYAVLKSVSYSHQISQVLQRSLREPWEAKRPDWKKKWYNDLAVEGLVEGHTEEV